MHELRVIDGAIAIAKQPGFVKLRYWHCLLGGGGGGGGGVPKHIMLPLPELDGHADLRGAQHQYRASTHNIGGYEDGEGQFCVEHGVLEAQSIYQLLAQLCLCGPRCS